MKITDINVLRRDAESAAVLVDGKRVAVLPVRVIEGLGLKVDGVWDADTATSVGEAMAYEEAYGAALSRLKRRALSAARLREKLSVLGHEPGVVERVIGRLTELGVLNDRSLGESVIVETQRGGAAGEALLREKLQKQGLDEAMIDSLIEDTESNVGDRVDQAVEVAEARLKSMGSTVDTATRSRRVSGMLARRGFDLDTIEAALERLGLLNDSIGD